MTRLKVFLIVLTTAGALGVAPARALTDVPGCDFNKDGRADVAVGVPSEDIGGVVDAGAVNVLYGSVSGVTPDGDQFVHQGAPGIPRTNEQGDRFGAVLACGDFDDNGADDLVVGVPAEDNGSVRDAGAVHVIPGSASGLRFSNAKVFTQGTSGIASAPAPGELFGAALAAGDFNGDGNDDLAIGVPKQDIEDVETRRNAGAVHVLYGSGSGLPVSGSEFLHQNASDIRDSAESKDRFGWALAAGDVDVDGKDDLAVGVPLENNRRGAVHLFHGHSTGTTTTGQQFLTQNSGLLESDPERNDSFGFSLHMADFTGSGGDDLAVGSPGEDWSDGAVHVLFAGGSGLSTTSTAFLTTTSDGQRFGTTLAGGDFDGDGDDDLAAGGTSLNYVVTRSGFSSGDPLEGAAWSQSTSGVKNTRESGDRFGAALASGDLDGDGKGDLVVGVPGEDLNGIADAGGANVLYGSANGLSVEGDQFLHQDKGGVKDASESGDSFGAALA